MSVGERKSSNAWDFDVATGAVSGLEHVVIGGYNPDNNGEEETTCDQGGLYTYLTANSTLYAMSTSTADTTAVIAVSGLDDEYLPVVGLATLTGQTPTALSSQMKYVHSSVLANDVDLDGSVYISSDTAATAGVPDTASAIKSKIISGFNTSNQFTYTVPFGKELHLKDLRLSVPQNKNVTVYFRVKPAPSSPWYKYPIVQAWQSMQQFSFDFYGPPLPTGGQIETRCLSSDNNTPITISVNGILKEV